MIRAAIICLLATSVLPAARAAARETKHVEIRGVRYRVTTVGDVVIVANKSVSVAWSIAERDAQREAVFLATGCRPIDELPSPDARLRAKLDCSAKPKA